jgi:hypothetical protein
LLDRGTIAGPEPIPHANNAAVPTAENASRIAVAIPCFNEAAAIATVLTQWRAALPEAEVVVFNNNSTDGTGPIATGMGVRVEQVPAQGKGHAVRTIFERLRDYRAVVLVDGDGTYPAEMIHSLLAPVLAGRADMTVGARKPVQEAGAMSPVRGLGNVLIRCAFRVLIGRGPGDLLSGYRVFSRTFLATVTLRSTGFEIETELAAEAVAGGLRVVEVPVPYRPRIAGSVSKLRAFRDGRRILVTIVKQSVRLCPWRPLAMVAGSLGACAVALRSPAVASTAAAAALASIISIPLQRRSMTPKAVSAPLPHQDRLRESP